MKNQTDPVLPQLCFGTVIIDRVRRILIRDGQRVDLSEAYWNALMLLVDGRPNVIAKGELQQVLQLSEQSLPKAIEIIRQAFGDTEDPRKFIITERGLGYRFIGIELAQPTSRRWVRISVIVASILIAVLFGVWSVVPAPRAKQFHRIARADRADIPLETDGRFIYFGQWDNGRFGLSRVSSTGGEPTGLETSLPNPELCDISPDGLRLLVRSIPPGGFRDNAAPLWIIRTTGEVVGSVGDVRAVDAAWMPDGNSITYSEGPTLYTVQEDGSRRQVLAVFDAEAKTLLWWLRWSKDGKRLRFTVTRPGVRGRTIWELSVANGDFHPLKGLEEFSDACCGSWSKNSHNFLFGATTREGATQIWAIDDPARDSPHLHPVLSPFGINSYRGPLVSLKGDKLFMRSTVAQGEIVWYDPNTHKWSPLLRDTAAGMMAVSDDGKKIAYTTLPELNLWIANADGTNRNQLTDGSLQVAMPRWSPRGDQLAFMGRLSGQTWKIYTVRFPRGVASPVLTDYHGEQADPDWSPTAEQLVFGQNPARAAKSGAPGVFLIDLQSGALSPLPDSGNLDSPRWSPDGHSIIALEYQTRRLLMYNVTSRRWSALTQRNFSNSGYPCWSRDSRFVYFLSGENRDDGTTENIVLRVDVKTRELRRFATLAPIRQGAFTFGTWIGLGDKDVLLAVRDLTIQEIDALDWP
jgi:Tol biopolymer transport system component